MLIIWTSVL